MNQIEIYQTKDKQTQIEVKFEEDTVWLTQQQMAQLFGQTKQNISLHINNCFKEKELDKKATVKESLTVQKEANRMVSRNLDVYNLDIIISVGYRVKSKRGTQFRQWATQRLKDHLVKGYTLNEKRLQQVVQNMQQLEQAVKIFKQAGSTDQLSETEARGLLDIITNYTQSFILLNRFDSNELKSKSSKMFTTHNKMKIPGAYFSSHQTYQVSRKIKDEKSSAFRVYA
ncbi:MAG: virulence RhuM family protein [Sphingobacteriales bacterium]|nr:virulence RhuM family protein [Sphingobacteriales bacterium]